MAQFKNMLPAKAKVWRDGVKSDINASGLVEGDLVEINNGDNIPADVVLIKVNDMKVNNSSLTGESEDIEKHVDQHKDNVFESPNVAFFGTFCTAGTGTGLVFKTGDRTVIGQIAKLAQQAEAAETPLAIEIEKFIKFISTIAISWGLIFFILGFIYGYDAITNLVFMIGIIVANVPEGLLMTVTLSLALTAKKMAEKMVLVKNMESVETLGSTSCICSDKTGTLTQNKMTVSHLFYDLSMFDASTDYITYQEQKKVNKDARLTYNTEDIGFKTLMKSIALSTKATFSYTPTPEEIIKELKRKGKNYTDASFVTAPDSDKREATAALIEREKKLKLQDRKVQGDASEAGLIKFIKALDILETVREEHPTFMVTQDDGKQVEALIPFSSEIKFAAYIRDMNKNDKKPKDKKNNLMILMKGAPDKIIERCNKMLI